MGFPKFPNTAEWQNSTARDVYFRITRQLHRFSHEQIIALTYCMQKGHLLTGMIVQGWKDFNFLLLGKILQPLKKTLSLVFSKMLMEKKKKNINMNDYNIFFKQAIFIFDKKSCCFCKIIVP